MIPKLTRLPLPREFFDRAPQDVARDLLGKALIRQTDDSRNAGSLTGGLIVETEAYLAQGDEASHSHRGPRPRNRSMFAGPGTLYVYTIHAKFCLNAVTEQAGVGSAVLIRALEPVWNLALMHERRKRDDPRELCRGPAKLCQALSVDLAHDGGDLCSPKSIWIEPGVSIAPDCITATPRIGIRRAADHRLRFFVDGNRFVSGRTGDHRGPAKLSLLADP